MPGTEDQFPTFELETVGVKAKGRPHGSRFTVLAGSQARAQVTDSYERYVPAGYKDHRRRLLDEGVLQPDPSSGELRFVRDEDFNGSTEAGCIVAGRMVNGIREWFVRDSEGKKQTHGQWLTWFWGDKDTPVFTLKTDLLTAYAQMRKGRFVVLAGSEAVKSMDSEKREIKQQLIDKDVLREKPDSHLFEFTTDTAFESATAASSVILLRKGGGSSGWIFQDQQGREVVFGQWMGMLSKIPSEVRQARLGLTQTTEQEAKGTEMLEAHGHREEILGDVVNSDSVQRNQILYGPPGTGKTYQVIERALAILDPDFLASTLADRAALKARYDKWFAAGAISFVTFHQSFGYEDFIEGIKPVMHDGQLNYQLEDGLFLEAVRAAGGTLLPAGPTAARQPVIQAHQAMRHDAQVWRIYIDGTNTVSPVRDRCLERGEIRVGSWKKSPQDLNTLSEEEPNPSQMLFRDAMRFGDMVLLAKSADSIGAVGLVDGDYHFDPNSDPLFADDYAHARPVHWLATELDVAAQDITGRKFAPPTLQRVAGATALEVLQRLHLGSTASPSRTNRPASRHVLIIDEINRGNVAKIFGELITLLEPEKRAGRPEALTVKLPLSRRQLSVPDSLYIIGTMNTADRSLTQLDTALRRRFVFHPVWPEPAVLPVLNLDGRELDLRKFLYAINDRIQQLLSREQVIGHAYLLGLPATLEGVASALRERILPQLEEYFFDDWARIREVLADQGKERHLQFVHQDKVGDEVRYRVNEAAFGELEAFTLVYSRMSPDVFPFGA